MSVGDLSPMGDLVGDVTPDRQVRMSAIARETSTHVEFAAVLALFWLTAPMMVGAASVVSPRLAQVTALDSGATRVLVADLWPLYTLLLSGAAVVLGISFVARVSLLPGVGTGDFHRDIGSRLSVRIGIVVGLANFVGLTLFTTALAEAWIFPLLSFSVCQLLGILTHRLRSTRDLLW